MNFNKLLKKLVKKNKLIFLYLYCIGKNIIFIKVILNIKRI